MTFLEFIEHLINLGDNKVKHSLQQNFPISPCPTITEFTPRTYPLSALSEELLENQLYNIKFDARLTDEERKERLYFVQMELVTRRYGKYE